MRTNLKTKYDHVQTHEGAQAFPHLKPIQQLRRSVLSCLLFEDEFYEDGQSIAARITATAKECKPGELAALAIEARSKFNLRHVPLLLLKTLAGLAPGTSLVGDTIAATIQRADEIPEFLALYWKEGKRPLSAQVKKGLAKAFRKFDGYALAKYNRDAAVKLRDALFLCHAKPADEAQAALWKQLVDGTLPAPDTWEVALSAGADKKATWERLIAEGKLGYLALLRNLRNMAQAEVDPAIMRAAIFARKGGAERVLPFRYVAAARACPQMEPALDEALLASLANAPKLAGRTIILVDVSRSMDGGLSEKSGLTRMDAAATLASIIVGDLRVFTFSDAIVEVAPRRGMAGVDAIKNSQPHNGTRLFDAVAELNGRIEHDRLIVITDEQATDPSRYGHWIQGTVSRMPEPKAIGYCINVASAKNGVGYGRWTHIDGFSEQVIRFIMEMEAPAS